ncbi:hypothetical protein FPV67DRAFT_1652399 [Lyophyllum atratum]|nr:hypothetical protein FPV67DRAFT_1652399 [Lyophyllum atratum]
MFNIVCRRLWLPPRHAGLPSSCETSYSMYIMLFCLPWPSGHQTAPSYTSEGLLDGGGRLLATLFAGFSRSGREKHAVAQATPKGARGREERAGQTTGGREPLRPKPPRARRHLAPTPVLTYTSRTPPTLVPERSSLNDFSGYTHSASRTHESRHGLGAGGMLPPYVEDLPPTYAIKAPEALTLAHTTPRDLDRQANRWMELRSARSFDLIEQCFDNRQKLVLVLGDAAQPSIGHGGDLYSQVLILLSPSGLVIPNAWTVDSACVSSFELNIRKTPNLFDVPHAVFDAGPCRVFPHLAQVLLRPSPMHLPVSLVSGADMWILRWDIQTSRSEYVQGCDECSANM